ncbi:PadR family transcriptional regulator [Spirosoma sp. SC4-14]|uniref:PadR family transcriptional regulator n=1 Tax=Spirosoma sp. SC4-14 TaxID=3128900 RepID=UPI0030D4E8E4
MDATGNEFLRGTLKTIVLKLLTEQVSPSGRGRMYGYEITQAVKERTKGEITLSFGALYPVLHKLEQEGLLITETEEVDGRLRKYYSLTPNGNKAAARKVSDFERFIEAMQTLLNPPIQLATDH